MMLNLLILVALSATSMALSLSPRVTGGSPAGLGEFPETVSVKWNGEPSCGGVLLNEKVVITAAHCVSASDGTPEPDHLPWWANGTTVQAGSLVTSSGGITVGVSKIYVHADYVDRAAHHDVALLYLNSSIKETSNIRYAKLPEKDADPIPGSTAVVAGWGHTKFEGSESPHLLKADIPVISRKKCNDYWSEIDRKILFSQMCAGTKKAAGCNGDSGGPLFDSITGQVIGIVSQAQRCSETGWPTVFASVSAYVDWIKEHASLEEGIKTS
ncbi:hypothetical protein LOZ58_000293 [Ophidiomyces ophidiicola]|nr:hypothetical protein LOZ58_000293 [Ophidiomyces ophidiicola]